MADLDLDDIEILAHRGRGATTEQTLALVAELRRLRAELRRLRADNAPYHQNIDHIIENLERAEAEVRRLRAVRDAAANLQEHRPDCDGSTYTIVDACREIWPDDPADWCATCVLVHCLEADQ